jgi:3-oxoacyl-[acyl-carrier-protein] synthase II
MNRVVITGIGVTSPVGTGRAAFWQALTAGRCGIGPIMAFDASSFPIRIAGEVRDLRRDVLSMAFPVAQGERDRKIWLGLAAASEAVSDASIDPELLKDASIHVGVGLESFFLEDITPAAGQEDLSVALFERLLRETERPALQTPLDRLATLLGDAYGLEGGRWTNCSACAAGTQAIGEAVYELREGRRCIAIAGAADSMINPLGFGGFSLLRVLSTENESPTTACRPFDATRQGTVLAEGAAFLVLETLTRARERGAKVYAELLGYGSSMDAFRVSDPEPSGRGAVLSMCRAIRDAGLRPDDIDAVSAHGTGTPKNDAVETAAIKEVLGPRARRIPVHAIKSMTGHMVAASGAAEAAAAALTLQHGVVPPTINLRTPDPQCDLDYVADGPRVFRGRTVLSNSFGFGGQNATLIFGRVEK